MLGAVTDLDVALITGGFTVAAVVVTFGGNALLDMARARRAGRESRDAAIAEVLAASMDLVLAVSAIRAAHQHRTNSRARMLIAAAYCATSRTSTRGRRSRTATFSGRRSARSPAWHVSKTRTLA